MSSPSTSTLVWLAVKPLLKLIIPAGMGFWLTKRGLFTVAGSRAAAQIILNVTLPSLLLSKIIPSFTPENVGAIGPIVLCAIVYMLLSGAFALLIRLFLPVPLHFRYGIIAAAVFSNWGDLPTSVVMTITLNKPFNGTADADLAIAYVAIFILVFYVTMFPLRGTWFIERDYKYAIDELEDEESIALTTPKPLVFLRSSVASVSGAVRQRKKANGEAVTVELQDSAPRSEAAPEPSAPTVPPATLDLRRTVTTRSHAASSVQDYAAIAHAASFEDVQERKRRTFMRRAHNVWATEKSRLSSIVGSRAPSIMQSDDHTLAPGTSETQSPIEPQTPASLKMVPEVSDGHVEARKPWYKSVGSFCRPFITPPTIALVTGLVCALVTPLKSLFVADTPGNFHPVAPDGQPALAIILDTASFVGAASVPLGLLVLGSALARMSLPRPITKLPIASIVALATAKLIVLPVIGFYFVDALVQHRIVDENNHVLRFTLIYFSAVPTATTQVALTQIYSGDGPSNSDILSAYLIAQYVVFAFSSVVLTALTLKSIS